MSEEILNRGIKKIRNLKSSPCYLAGGYIRNRLLGEKNNDADIVSDEKDLPRRFARATGYSFFTLKGGYFSRVVRGDLSWDFTPLGGDIKKNLSARDFRCDALGLDIDDTACQNICKKMIDPCGGLDDIDNKEITPVNEDIFKDDPVRIMRAFTLYSKLDFSISSAARELIQRDKKLLGKSKGERVWEEIKKISAGAPDTIIKIADMEISPALYPGARGKEEVKEIVGRTQEFKKGEFKDDPVFIAASLWEEEGAVGRLKFSSKETNIFKDYTAKETDLFSCFKRRGPDAERIFKVRYVLSGEKVYLKALKKDGGKLKKLSPESLLSGEEIMNILHISPSPAVGDIKEKLLRAQFKGLVKNKKEAVHLIENIQ